MPKLSAYELERQANIVRNNELLKSLGLGDTSAILGIPKPKIPKPSKMKKAEKKRKADAIIENDEGDNSMQDGSMEESTRSQKSGRREDADADAEETPSLRRSSRHAGKSKVNYNNIDVDRSTRSVTITTRAKQSMGSDPSVSTMRVNNPKQYGSIPGISIGTWWETRMDCSKDAIHAPVVAGITCGPQGAYSVALSGGYDDDVDLGYGFTYTGSGGRDLKGTKQNPKNLRTAPQSSDQSFDHPFNAALKRSAETRKPVRVIRGYKLKSQYAPYEGYRYDGLYVVEKAWMERGRNSKGYLVCKYALKRLPGQPPLPTREEDTENDNNGGADETDDEGTRVSETEATSTTQVEEEGDGEEFEKEA